MSDIEWRAIPGYEGYYEVSDTGLIRSLDRMVKRGNGHFRMQGRVLRAGVRDDGHLQVPLSVDGQQANCKVHRAVLIAFVGPPPSEASASCHVDGNPANNNLANLYWGDRSTNSVDMVRHGVHNNARKTECKNGHRFTPENTINNKGKRTCRECNDGWQRRYRERDRLVTTPLDWAKCGTAANYRAHLRRGQTPCAACKAAQNRYTSDYKRRRRAA